MSDLVAQTKREIQRAFGNGMPVYLAYSGGKESVVLAHLCHEFQGHFKLVWANTGYMFPHVESFIRSVGERYGLIELKSDLISHWQSSGLPSSVVPIANALGDNCHTEPKMHAWLACCSVLRGRPIADFIERHDGPLTLLHGQRFEDKAPGMGFSLLPEGKGHEAIAPLAQWSEGDVMDYVKEHGLDLPSHYGEVMDSLDCWVCPAAFGEKHGAARVEYMAKEHPGLLRMVLPGAQRVHAAAQAAVEQLKGAIDAGTPVPSPRDDIVPQRSPEIGDCAIAALATATGHTYENIASVLGFPCDPQTGLPSMPVGRGINLIEIPVPLLSLGISASLVMTKESPEAVQQWKLPTSAELKGLLKGRDAVLMVFDKQEGRMHALAWKDGRLTDCRSGAAHRYRFDEITILGAILWSSSMHAA